MADFDRPLNKRGKRDAPEMGDRLQKQSFNPDLILSSSARRAQDTINLIAKEIGFPGEKIIYQENLYLAGAFDLVALLQEVEDRHQHVVLCGHNPGLTEVIPLLTRANLESVPTCGIVQIEFKVYHWSEVAASRGDLLLFDYPKNEE